MKSDIMSEEQQTLEDLNLVENDVTNLLGKKIANMFFKIYAL